MGFEDTPPFSANQIWKVDTLPRIKTFLWMCAYNSIGVKVCLQKRGVESIGDEVFIPFGEAACRTGFHLMGSQIANRCANSLARMSICQDFEFSSLDSLPVDITNVFEDDLNGMYSIRICPKPIVAP
ncbi:hypothetical protein SO802_006944 [Lithocarpus litseifolius]|uniref:Reverse transcriptase zinc-binding domain-containing protein n=1 Tax=Lithocarpus litseifolius TaxID=425828 RepID=A0AAW2DS96_9ROSI